MIIKIRDELLRLLFGRYLNTNMISMQFGHKFGLILLSDSWSEPTESWYVTFYGLVQKKCLFWFIFCFDGMLSYRVDSIVEYM